MVLKKCCIEKCKSSSNRKEANGVTYHKFPRDASVRDAWVQVTRHPDVEPTTYVCSLHFYKKDFQMYQGSKYVLKSGAIPSIFPWTKEKLKKTMDELDLLGVDPIEDKNVPFASSSSEPENLEAIKRFIEAPDKAVPEEIVEIKIEPELTEGGTTDVDKSTNDLNIASDREEPLAIATSVMDFIINETASKFKSNKSDLAQGPPLQNDNSGDKGASSVALSVGSKVEARDFAETWYSAEIVEVDYDEMEVLVRYEITSKKPEEWISVYSPRLRPVTKSTKPAEGVEGTPKIHKPVEVALSDIKDEIVEDKPKAMFTVGERCLARWRDNRRFVATIHNDLGNGSYEIIFEDGFFWKCSGSRLSKLKTSGKIDTSIDLRTCATPSPSPDAILSSAATPSPVLAFHKHLFDPTRDYLGSKSERRELKRKLNIKEIFNIGQKQRRKEVPAKEEKPKEKLQKKPRIHKNKVKTDLKAKVKLDKKEIPDAIASIIGTVTKDGNSIEITKDTRKQGKSHVKNEKPTKKLHKEVNTEWSEITFKNCGKICDTHDAGAMDVDVRIELEKEKDLILTDEETQSAKLSDDELDDHEEMNSGDQDPKSDPIQEEVTSLQNFEKPDDVKHEQVIDRIKEAINKLEDGLNRDLKPVDSAKVDDKEESAKQFEVEEKLKVTEVKNTPDLKEMGWEQGAKATIDELNSKLEEMKAKMSEMETQMILKSQALDKLAHKKEMLESKLPPEEWCCKWFNGEPVGNVVDSEPDNRVDVINKIALPRKTIQVQDSRLPEGWTKLMVRRSLGHSAGKWDVVLVSPENRKFHTKTDMRHFLETNTDPALIPYENALLDFAVHLKLARRLGWVTQDSSYVGQNPLNYSMSHKRKRLRHKSDKERRAKKRKLNAAGRYKFGRISTSGLSDQPLLDSSGMMFNNSTLEDGYVYVGSLKIQVIDNLLRCPAEGCLKNFRNNTLLQMHIKHYHRDLRKMLGATPKVLDLAYARTVPMKTESKSKHEPDSKIIKVKIPRPPKRIEEKLEMREINIEPLEGTVRTPAKLEAGKIPRSMDSPMMRQMQPNRPIKRPKVLLPVRRPEPVDPSSEMGSVEDMPGFELHNNQFTSNVSVPAMGNMDFEAGISTHTVTRVGPDDVRKRNEKRKVFATNSKAPLSEDEDTLGMTSDMDTRSSFPGSGTPDSKTTEVKCSSKKGQTSSESNEERSSPQYVYTDTGECVILERMKRDEIINCFCGYREEDGLMVQCELCLCWQHALCYNMQRESDVPKKYTCYICLNPLRGRRSQRFLQDQDRMTEGLLPGGKPLDTLRRSHELSAQLLKILDAMRALRLKHYVATKKNHPKLYLFAKEWSLTADVSSNDEKSGNRSDRNTVDKENMPVVEDVAKTRKDIQTSVDQEDRFSQRDGSLTNHSLLGGLLSSPGGTSLEMPTITSELERLANSVEAQETPVSQPVVTAPEPEAAIENSVCRERLLNHLHRCQAEIESKLDSVEASVIELEAQDPSIEEDSSEDFSRTKQTIQMLLRDLETMQHLGIMT